MPFGPLDFLPLWGLFLFAAGLMTVAMEAGYRAGQWRRKQSTDEKEQPVGAMVASILGLVALVLGFTFSFAASRFDARRQAVLEEANAIGTTYLRARMLPDAQRDESMKLLREYTNVRAQVVSDGNLNRTIARSEELHELLWLQAKAAADSDPKSIPIGLFIQSLNEVIDVHSKRVLVGLRSRIPLVIWIGVFGLAILGMGSVGYQTGLSGTLRSPMMLGMVLAFVIVLMLIADLDRGQEGLLRVGQQALSDLQRSIAQPP